MNFKISDKVVTVGLCRGEAHSQSLDSYRVVGPFPVIGEVYVVEAVLHCTNSTGLALVGSTSICRLSGREVGFDSRCFRLLADVQLEAKARASAQ